MEGITHQEWVEELYAQLEDKDPIPVVEFYLDEGEKITELVIMNVKFENDTINVKMGVF